MKSFLAGILRYHLLPILIAGVLASLAFVIYFKVKPHDPYSKIKIVSGQQKALRGTFANFPDKQTEIELAASLQNPQMIAVFGSSEMGVKLQYSPYFFLPDSLNMPTIGFGHAHHQTFSMFCELLAMEELLPGSKVCILLSPGWFETDGTNTEAFLEFVRPGFLKAITHNENIPLRYKEEIGRFISEHYDEIDQPAEYLNYFRNLYESRNIPLLSEEMKANTAGIDNLRYKAFLQPAPPALPPAPIDWERTGKRVQENFISGITTNKLFVNDTYFMDVLQPNGPVQKGKVQKIASPGKNREFRDLLLLTELLKRKGCRATFIIQPLNPYYYEGLENYNEIVAAIESRLREQGFPYLNLFVTDRRSYEPGTLDDVMHLGDYGWLKVDRFLYENYK